MKPKLELKAISGQVTLEDPGAGRQNRLCCPFALHMLTAHANVNFNVSS